MTFIQQNNQYLLKEGRKIKGFVTKAGPGYGYAFGKPSQPSYLVFSKNEGHYTLEEAKEKLLNQVLDTNKALSSWE